MVEGREPREIRRALVVGSSGFWGSWVVDAMVRRGIHVTGLSRIARLPLPGLLSPTENLYLDISTNEIVEHLEGYDAIVFLAGRASVPQSVSDPLGDLDGNTRNVVRILQVLRRLEVPPMFVHASSAAVYGSGLNEPMAETHPLAPLSPYGVSKLFAEKYVQLYAREFGVPGVSVRPFSIYGPGQKKQVVYDLSARIARSESPLIMLGSPEVSRDFVYVSDASEALLSVIESAAMEGEAYNIGSGLETTLGALAQELVDIAGSPAPVDFSGHVREGDPLRWCADVTALVSLGFSPKVSLHAGLDATFAWVRSNLSV